MMLSVDLVIRKGTLALDARFEAASGITVVQAPSGAGKTSVLRAIAGLDRHAGKVAVGDTIWQDATRFRPVHQRNLGFAFQGALLPHLTVEANLRFVMRRRTVGAARLTEVAAQTGIEHLFARAAPGLSGGEQQRVALACALLPRPDLLLLDEPLSSLDGDAKAVLLPLIRSLDTPVLLVTHDPAEAAFLADRVFTIQDGKVVEAVRSTDPLQGRSRAEIEALARAALAHGLEA